MSDVIKEIDLEKTLNDLNTSLDAYVDAWAEHLQKTAHDKNISIGEWNELLQRTAVVSKNLTFIVNAVTDIISKVGTGNVPKFENQASVTVLQSLNEVADILSQLSVQIVPKVTEPSDYSRVYAVSQDGALQTVVNYTSEAIDGTIMFRDSAGRSKVATPAVANDATNKGYVDALYTELKSSIDGVSELISDVVDGGAF